MQFDDAFISKLETLARLELQPEDRTRMAHDLEKILKMIQLLEAAPLEGVEPMVYLNDHIFDREDTVGDHLPPEAVLKNAPASDGAYFITPKVK